MKQLQNDFCDRMFMQMHWRDTKIKLKLMFVASQLLARSFKEGLNQGKFKVEPLAQGFCGSPICSTEVHKAKHLRRRRGFIRSEAVHQ